MIEEYFIYIEFTNTADTPLDFETRVWRPVTWSGDNTALVYLKASLKLFSLIVSEIEPTDLDLHAKTY